MSDAPMEEQTLARLLHRADEPTPPGDNVVVVADRVRGEFAKRRTRRRRGKLAAAALVLLTTSVAVWSQFDQNRGPHIPNRIATTESKQPKPESPSTRSYEEVMAEIERLDAEADMHLQAARMIRTALAEQRAERELREQLRKGDPIDWIHEQQNRTALAMLMRAERLSQQPNSQAEVEATYQEIINLFPSTPTAELARRRLDGNDMGDRT